MKTEFAECPLCKSKDILSDELEKKDNRGVWRTARCQNPKCGYEWEEVFLFDHAECAGGGNEIDKNGKLLLSPDFSSEDPKYSRVEWQYMVNNKDTNLGYWDWVHSCKKNNTKEITWQCQPLMN
jgi:hypothetical protein